MVVGRTDVALAVVRNVVLARVVAGRLVVATRVDLMTRRVVEGRGVDGE